MDADELKNLLRRADEATILLAPSAELANRVRVRFARRRRMRAGVAGIVSVVVLTLAASQFARHTPRLPDEPAETLDVLALRAEVEELGRQADLLESGVDRLLAAQQRRSSVAKASPPIGRTDPVMELQWQREQAALVLVRQGDRLADELNLPEPATFAYRQASETFAGTHWAAVAQQRLAKHN